MSRRITEGPDGKFRWTYDLNMYRSPVILWKVWKLLFLIFAGIFLFVFLLSGARWELEDLKFLAYFLTGVLVLSLLSYWLLAAGYGGVYRVEFTMSDQGISHTQVATQAEKARKLGLLTLLLALASKNPGAAGSGLLTMTHTSLSTDFARLKKVRWSRRLGVIWLDEPFSHNMVFADGEDFDMVLDYIRERTPETAVIRGRA